MPRHIKLGFILHGVGRTWNDWRHPDRDVNASTSLAFYQQQAALAERGHVADRIEQWVDGEAADGFVLFEAVPGQLQAFVEKVVPILQSRGRLRTEYEGHTLRDNLGLAEPENRYTAARAAVPQPRPAYA